MELWQEMLCNLLRDQCVEVYIPQLSDVQKLLETDCYRALKKIKDIIEDETLDDETCFLKIEEIICAFEALGSDGGIDMISKKARHPLHGCLAFLMYPHKRRKPLCQNGKKTVDLFLCIAVGEADADTAIRLFFGQAERHQRRGCVPPV